MHAWLFRYHLDCTKIPGLWSDKKLTGRWGGPAQALAVFSLEAGRSPCGTPCPELAWALPCSTLYLCGSTAPHVGEKCSTTYFLPRNSRLYSVISLFTMSGFYSLNSNSRLWVSWKQPQESGRALSELGNFHFSPEEATIINSSTEEAEVWKWPPVPLLGITGWFNFYGDSYIFSCFGIWNSPEVTDDRGIRHGVIQSLLWVELFLPKVFVEDLTPVP